MCDGTVAARIELLRSMARAHRDRPADYRDDLPGQAAFLAARERRVIWFGANGQGKTQALARRLIRVFEGRDPICLGIARPLTCLLVVTGYDAASCRDLADQLHALMPAGLVAQVALLPDGTPSARCSPWHGAGKGFRGRPPRLVVQRGPLAGTTLNVATLGSGVLAAAGGTVDLVLVNEPITRALFEELSTRDRASALGYLWYLLTPIPGAPDQTWIPEMAQAMGPTVCRYMQTSLTRASLVLPSGRALESWESKTLPRIASWSPTSRRQRMGESLEPLYEGTFFSDVWREELLVDSRPAGDLWLIGSLDHGMRQGRLRVGVSGWRVEGRAGERRLYGCLLCEIAGSSASEYEAARDFLTALDRAEIPLDAIDEWVGDRATVSSTTLVRRDNLTWRGSILRVLRERQPDTPPTAIYAPRQLWEIRVPRKVAGSVDYGLSVLRGAMAESPPRYTILREHCPYLPQDVQRWDGRWKAAEKDGLDMARYALEAAYRHYGLWRDEP